MSPRIPRSLLAPTWTTVRLPDRSLADAILAFAAPVIEALGPAAAIGDVRAEFAQVIELWNVLG